MQALLAPAQDDGRPGRTPRPPARCRPAPWRTGGRMAPPPQRPSPPVSEGSAAAAAAEGMRWIPGGEFLMGSDRHSPDERPAHRAEVAGFLADATAVTNA